MYNREVLLSFLLLKHHIRKDDVKRTLLFIDEIQEETKAVQMLRYFYEQTPWLYVIAAGSRLQLLIKPMPISDRCIVSTVSSCLLVAKLPPVLSPNNWKDVI